jgi:ATP-dependent helicase/nuclease subunit A
MDRKWTPAQKQAIEAKGSVLVSASAGTGKTAVLTEKVSNCIVKENIDIKDILVMTFSSAAAEEMKDRIMKKLRELSRDKSLTKSQRHRIYEELKDFYTANIQTIHAFCNEIVKTYFYKVGLDPKMNIADNFDVNILKMEAVKEVLDEEYFLMHPDFVVLEEYIDGTDTLENVIIKTHEKMMSFINPFEWLNSAVEDYNIGDKLPEHLKEMIIEDFSKALNKYKEALEELEDINDPKMDKNLSIMRTDINILNNIIKDLKNDDINALNPESLSDFAQTIRFPSKDNTFDLVKELRNEAKDFIVKKYKNTNFDLSEQIERINTMYPIVLRFKELIIKYDKKYTEKKEERKIIDFNDMEKYALLILEDDSISDAYKSKYKRVFVDEYQDTSPVQEAIIDKISRENNKFFVGDLKQSIYGFRASDPLLFKSRSDSYKNKTLPGNVISLSNNFRSSQNILDCANDVFNHITKASKDINYSEEEKLVHGREDDSKCNPVVLNILSEDIKNFYPNLSTDEIEIYNIVKIIKEQLGKLIYDPKINNYRPTEYKDIVVSCRKLTGLSDYFAQIFTSNNIPFYIEKAGNLLQTVEIQILMNLIDLINNSQNDIKLISVIHAGLFNFNDDDLIALRVSSSKESFYKIILSKKDEVTELGYKCQRLINFLSDVKSKESKLTLTELIDYIIQKTNYNDIFAIMNNGKQKIANIQLFKKHAYDFEAKSNEKLLGFMNYLKKVQETEEQVDEAKVNYSENSVRITTIHKSKGLEYPVEIMGFMGKAFSTIDKRANIVLDRDAGIGFRFFDDFDRVKGKTLQRTYVEKILTEKLIEEEMRLLYVAMTRAQEQLFIQAMVPSNPAFSNLLESNSMMDWILSTLSTSGNSEDLFVSEDKEKNIKLVGDWNIKFVEETELFEFVENSSITINNKDFIDEYSVPFIPYEETIKEKETVIPVSIPSSKIKSIVKAEFDPFVGDFDTPSFMSTSSTDTARIGTVTHEFMKNLDLKQSLTFDNIIEQKNNLIKNNIMFEEDLKLVNYNKIAKFFTTNIGNMIKSANKVLKEKNMNILKSAMDIGLDDDSREILIRCIVDLVIEVDGKYYLLDYKTDRIKDKNDTDEIAARIQSHKDQMGLYNEAFENIYGKTIEKSYLIFLDISEAVEIVW